MDEKDINQQETTTPVENATETKVPTFQELLDTNKDYQREFDKRVSKALDTSKAKWESEAEAQRNEAQKLAKMDADEKLKYELKQALNKVSVLEAKENASQLEKQATDIAREKNLDTRLVGLIDFKTATAESVITQIGNIKDIFDKAVEDKVNERLKEPARKQVANAVSDEEDSVIQSFLNEFKR